MDRPSSSDDDDTGRRSHDRVHPRPTHPASTSTHPSSKKRQKPLQKPPPHSHSKRRRHARDDRRNTDKTYRYGNYDRYYGYRVGASMEDHRLAAMREEWFRGKRVCDVGCNDGLFSLSLARAFSPRSMLCVDIDADLVDRGRGKLEALRRYAAREAREAIEKGEEDDEDEEDADAGGSGLADAGETLGGVEFRHANAVDFNFGVEKYDAILLLSVTKWIQLNWGDDGLKKVFQKCRDALTPGGCLVVEPQPWKSYKSSLRKRVFGQKLLPPECVERYRDITLRPRDFAGYLLSPEGGFESSETLRVGGSSDDGFDRDILRFVKATGDEE